MILLVCTAILYNDDPTVLVRTVPAFLLVIATRGNQSMNTNGAVQIPTKNSMHVRISNNQ